MIWPQGPISRETGKFPRAKINSVVTSFNQELRLIVAYG